MRIDSSGNLLVGTTTNTNTSRAIITGSAAYASGISSGLEVQSGGSGSNGGQIGLINTYSGASNPNKWLRVDNAGSLNVINSAYTTTILTLDNSGNLSTTGTISDSIGNVRTIVQNSQTTAYTLVATDNGKFISITTGGVTVPASIFSAGQNIVIFNNSSSTQTITQGSSVTMTLAGSTTTGNRSLAANGVATVLCTGTNTFVITGQGLT